MQIRSVGIDLARRHFTWSVSTLGRLAGIHCCWASSFALMNETTAAESVFMVVVEQPSADFLQSALLSWGESSNNCSVLSSDRSSRATFRRVFASRYSRTRRTACLSGPRLGSSSFTSACRWASSATVNRNSSCRVSLDSSISSTACKRLCCISGRVVVWSRSPRSLCSCSSAAVSLWISSLCAFAGTASMG